MRNVVSVSDAGLKRSAKKVMRPIANDTGSWHKTMARRLPILLKKSSNGIKTDVSCMITAALSPEIRPQIRLVPVVDSLLRKFPHGVTLRPWSGAGPKSGLR